jgi:hypothetical protein
MNFDAYNFEGVLLAPGPSSPTEWSGIRVEFYPSLKPAGKGAWLVYQICAIRNDAPKAQIFNYDVSKFYVEYQGRRHYYRPLVPYTFVNPSNHLPGTPAVAAALSPSFRTETQLGPDAQGIGPNSGETFSVAWRIAIFVMTTNPADDVLKLELPLFYDDTPVLMVNRNNAPESLGGFEGVGKSDLPISCRPPAKS